MNPITGQRGLTEVISDLRSEKLFLISLLCLILLLMTFELKGFMIQSV